MRGLLVVLFALFAPTASAQWSSQAIYEYNNALTLNQHFGLPRYTTAQLATSNPCNAGNKGAIAYDSTTNTIKVCDGSTWSSNPLGGGIIVGTTSITDGSDGDILYNNGGVVGGFQLYDDTGAGNGAFALRKTMTGDSLTSNFSSVTGTTPTTLTAAGRAVSYQITGAGSSAQDLAALRVDLLAGFTGAGTVSAAVRGSNTSSNAGGSVLALGTFGGFFSAVNNVATSWTTGVHGEASNPNGTGSAAVGVSGDSIVGGNTRIGGTFRAAGGTTNFGVVGFLGSGQPFLAPSAAGLFNNGAVAAPIIAAIDNSAAIPTTGATATWQVKDGAIPQVGLGVLTSATMTAENQAQATGGLVHSYTWTNAQVVALGAATTGDITVATLPAKTVVRNAYVVITGAAAGPATVTVSCGDANGGTPFIDYIIASDAKAAANTVYGDAAAERGTSIDVEFYYLPSYTGTTLVTCHFISTGANLDTVTGSTGRVILETVLVP